jgi:ArsR family transcriptional regulator
MPVTSESSGSGGGPPQESHAEQAYTDAAAIFKALGHPLRVRIVCGLLKESCTQTRIAESLDLPQSTVAQHLDVLRRIGIVEGKRDGAEVVLRVADGRIPELLRAVCREEAVPTFGWESEKSSAVDQAPR